MSENHIVDASYRITVEELLTAHSMATKVLNSRRPWLLREKPGTRWVAGLMAIWTLLCLVFSAVLGFGSSGQYALLAVLLVMSCFVFCLPWITKRGLRRRFEKMPARDKMIHFSIDADAVSLGTEGLTESSLKWKAYLRVARTAQGFLFFQDDRIYNWLPNHAFASEEDADVVANLASQHAAEYLDLVR